MERARRPSWLVFPLLAAALLPRLGPLWLPGAAAAQSPDPRRDVAAYVLTHVLDGDYGGRTLWMHDVALDGSHVGLDVDGRLPAVQFPFASNWLVMIDDTPQANWAHPVRWVFVDATLQQHTTPIVRSWPPTIRSGFGQGPRVHFGCTPYAPAGCPSVGPPAQLAPFTGPLKDSCLHAVLISGGWDDDHNFSRYAENLTSVYRKLRALGFPQSNLWTYYADGRPLDLDNADGDNNNATGSDVTDSANEAAIRARIHGLCTTLNATRDVLLLYTSNHGASNGDLVLWDFNQNGARENAEGYSPAELDVDTSACQVCRLFMLFDQCFSGAFVPLVTDGSHGNAAIYTAATASEYSYGREYMDWWEDLNPATMTMKQLHASVVASGTMTSTPMTAEGTPGDGSVFLNYCWGDKQCAVPAITAYCLGIQNITVDLTICNGFPTARSFAIDWQGEAAGGSCDVAGPASAVLPNPPIIVPGAGCATFQLHVPIPPGVLLPGQTACYSVGVTNLQENISTVCTGKLVYTPLACFDWNQLVARAVLLSPGDPVTVVGTLSNNGLTGSAISYQFVVQNADPLGANDAITLNGLPPGIPVTGRVVVPPGQTATLRVDVLWAVPPSPCFHNLLFEADLNGDGQMVPLNAVTLHLAPDGATTSPPTPQPRGLRLRIAPNPFNPTARISFDLTGARQPVSVEVLDARGRTVRTLLQAVLLEAGPHELSWNGDDALGRAVASGTYLVQVTTARGIETARATLLK
jgi:hypothetical protein